MGANVWLLKGYFDTVPREIDEAAIVDGASHARIFFTMHLRLVMPILVTVCMLVFVGLYSEFMLASIFLTDVDSQTLGVGLYAHDRGRQEQATSARSAPARSWRRSPSWSSTWPSEAARSADSPPDRSSDAGGHRPATDVALQPHHDGSARYVSDSAPGLGDAVDVLVARPARVRGGGVHVRTVARRRAGVRPGRRRRQAHRRHRRRGGEARLTLPQPGDRLPLILYRRSHRVCVAQRHRTAPAGRSRRERLPAGRPRPSRRRPGHWTPSSTRSSRTASPVVPLGAGG